MKKNAQVPRNAQIPFTIINWSNQRLVVGSPALCRRLGLNEPFEYLKAEEFTDTFSIHCSIDTRQNDHGQTYSYNTSSQELIFKSPHTVYRFNLNKFGNQVIYSTSSPGARISTPPFIFDDFSMLIQLEMLEPGTEASQKTDKANRQLEHLIGHPVIQHPSNDPVHPAPKEKASQVVIGTTDKFSFLSNVNLYFSGGDVYQESPPGQMNKVDRHGRGFPGPGTDFYLTPDKGYPPGVTTLTIKDGFSEATAVVKFDHDTSRKQVTITIESFTSKLCDIRDFEYLDRSFPNAICMAL
ncbi:hypothetical protein HU762_13555 [Pseudomonas sp. SWRI92]|uniref:Uncharacterized protein n=1 Tax=Pseudomonas marvdashtae TaxID=2745500 RepID=A0A923JNZ0_9PSED|nr:MULTISPECIES: hypothetical protein [Pseudomonas]MBC3374972.1 hypothetical protein [Pseudomonas sp. SWRI92]MBV4551307.1 hypothetical protein [Pseudomonas marvdashtae]